MVSVSRSCTIWERRLGIMKKYNVPLALASTGDDDKLALARMIIDLMERNELYEPLECKGSFENLREDLRELNLLECFRIMGIDSLSEERLKRLDLDEENSLKNYDVALAIATTGNIEGARRVMEAVDPKKELTTSDFKSLEDYEFEKAREIQEIRDLHKRLFKLLRDKNLPHPETPREDKIYLEEIVTGWKRLGIERHPGYEKTSISEKMSLEDRKSFEKLQEKFIELGLIEKRWFNNTMRQELSSPTDYGGYGACLPSQLKFIDYVMCDLDNIAWIIEGKKKLNYEAIGQVLVYSDLFIEDNPIFSEVRKAIVCEETDPVLEATCKKYNIEILTFS